MKTAKIFLSILGVTLVTLSFGQLIAQTSNTSDLNMASIIESENEVLFYTASFNAEDHRTIHWVNQIPGTYYPSISSIDYESLLVSRAYFARDVKANYEEITGLESWMTIPFRSSLEEPESGVERWMITPFESEIADEDLEVESWMISEWI